MVDVALRFGPAEYFALTVLAFVAVSAGARRLAAQRPGQPVLRPARSGSIGIDPLTGEARFTFGIPQLLDGIDVVVVAVGLFAVGETLYAGVEDRHRATIA